MAKKILRKIVRNLPVWIKALLLLAAVAFAYYLGSDAGPLAPALAPAFPAEQLAVHFIDVGQGSSILVTCGGEAMLVDGGDAVYGAAVRRYLKAAGVERLAVLVATHPHADHIGGLAAVAAAIPVERVLLPQVPEALLPEGTAYPTLLAALSAQGAPREEACAGGRFALGGAVVEILGPPTGEAFDNLNDYSVILRICYGQTAFLLTGDCEAMGELALLGAERTLAADVLGVPHHGAATGCSPALLAAVSPAFAAISVGADNEYGHPAGSTLANLAAAGAEILRTDLSGDIVFVSDGAKVRLWR